MLDRYYIEHELGSGARGAVFRARDRRTGRLVAIKLVPDPVSYRPRKKNDRNRPHVADVGAHLAHPHLPTIFETGRSGYLRYVVMEFAEGTDLRAHSDASTLLPLSTILSLITGVADALQHLHDRGIAHGDIKPANVVFDRRSQSFKLTDVPMHVGDMEARAGTPAYMSPERLCGSPPSPMADQFSLGVTLYQLVCGHLPFTGRSRAETVYRIVNDPHADVRVHDSSLPPALAAVIDRLLAKDVQARFPSIAILKRALADVTAEARDSMPSAVAVARRCPIVLFAA